MIQMIEQMLWLKNSSETNWKIKSRVKNACMNKFGNQIYGNYILYIHVYNISEYIYITIYCIWNYLSEFGNIWPRFLKMI